MEGVRASKRENSTRDRAETQTSSELGKKRKRVGDLEEDG